MASFDIEILCLERKFESPSWSNLTEEDLSRNLVDAGSMGWIPGEYFDKSDKTSYR